MFLFKKSSFASVFCLLLIITLISPMLLEPIAAVAATSSSWSKKLDKDIDWIIQTEFDVLLVGSNKKLYAISERRGEQLWSIEIGSEIGRTDVTLIDGTDIVLVNREIDKEKSSYKLEAYEVITGTKIWGNNLIKGRGIDILPLLSKNSFLYLIDKDENDKVRPHLYNFDIYTGKITWESEFSSSFNGTKSSGFWVFGNNYDVSGFYPPVFINNEIFFFYDGVRSFDYKTGKQLWYASYTLNKEEDLLRTDADPIITDSTIYTSGAGVLRAINRKDGNVIWTSEDFGVVIPLMYYDNGHIYAQCGGTFIKPNLSSTRDIDQVGVFAIDAKTGSTLWKFWNCQTPVSNISFAKDKIFLADKVSLIAIDKKTGKDTYKTTLDFLNPVVTAVYDKNNTVIVRSGQKVASYDIDSGHKVWINGFKEQPPGFLDKVSNRLLIGAAIIVFTGGLATPLLLGSYIAYDVNRTINRNAAEDRLCRQAEETKIFWGNAKSYRNSPGFLKAVEIRNERLELLTKQKKAYFYVYGEDEKNSDIKGVGGVNLDTGKMDFKADLGNDKPAYFYDRIYGLLFYTDGQNLSAYKIY
jgi:hypothetical protein